MECRESKSSSTLFGISCDPAMVGCAGKELELLWLLLDDLTFDVGDTVPLVPPFNLWEYTLWLASLSYYLRAVNPDTHTIG